MEDLSTKSTRMEVCWGRPRPSLHIVSDQGLVAWGNKFDLVDCDRGGLRGWVEPDVRQHNNFLVSLARSDLNWCKLEIGLTCSVASAPAPLALRNVLVDGIGVSLKNRGQTMTCEFV